jgi:hypothetical protein
VNKVYNKPETTRIYLALMWVYDKLDIDLTGSDSVSRLDSLSSASCTALAIRKAEYTGWTYSTAQLLRFIRLQSCNL